MTYCVTKSSTFPANLAAELGTELTANFDHFVDYSSAGTELFWAVASLKDVPVAAAPVVRLSGRPATEMLRPEVRRWLGWLGPLARKTTLLIDSAFLAYDDHSPFLVGAAVPGDEIRRAICQFLKRERRVDTIWINEPESAADWAAREGFVQFYNLPIVHVDLAGCEDLESYFARLSKKRRRNARQERERFESAGARVETWVGPLGDAHPRLDELLSCLRASAAHSKLTVPYNDVLTGPTAFAEQDQTVLAAVVDGRVVGFMSFLHTGGRLMQCHGGLDYDRSLEVCAYHNLIYAGIEMALTRGCQLLSMGPLNNETKRCAGTTLKPIVANLWSRLPGDRWVGNNFFVPNFQVYRGPYSPPLT